jgi:DNA (cytosine-5)-methyltransferase 1
MASTNARHPKFSHPEAAVRRAPREVYAHLDQLPVQLHSEHLAWREATIGLIKTRADLFPTTARLPLPRIGALVDKLAGDLHRLAAVLSIAHGNPDLGNKEDPVDELVYIILSRRTREGSYQGDFERLKQSFSSWEELADAGQEELERLLYSSGFSTRKARTIKHALRTLIETFGRCTLDPTRSWTDVEVANFLCSLPEVGPKSAACVMMCSLDRPAFPVDAHVGRVVERLGVFRRIGLELAGRDHKQKQAILWDLVPPSLRYTLHVNAVAHGRALCLPFRPRCTTCSVGSMCAYSRAGGAVEPLSVPASRN